MNFNILGNLFSSIWAIFLVIFFLGGSIFIHELGHFLAAKRRGIKIERFSIGFGPKLWTWRKDEIEYCISLLPFGGYVTLPQIANMSAIEGNTKEGVIPVSYASKVIVASMGAIFNLIFAFVLALILWVTAEPSSHEQQTNIVGYVGKTIQLDLTMEAPGPAYAAGIVPGDKILKVDGTVVNDFNEVQQLIVTGSGRTEEGKPFAMLTIERDNKVLNIPIEPQMVQLNVTSDDRLRTIGVSPAQLLEIHGVMKGSPAEAAGIKEGDVLLEADGQRLYSLRSLSDMLKKKSGEPVAVKFRRNDELMTVDLKAELVPFTKPLVKLDAVSEDKEAVSLQFVPLYKKNTDFLDLTATTNAATLELFETNISGTFLSDTIVSVNEREPKSVANFVSEIDALSPKEVVFLMHRINEADYELRLKGPYETSIIEPQMQAMIGIEVERTGMIKHVNPIKQFSANIAMTFRTLGSLMNKDSSVSLQNLMGPPGIIRTLYTFLSQDFRLLLWLVILLNINLAIINLLPIPVLDGGHILFFTIHKLRGKPLPATLIALLQTAFMVILFGMMIYVSFLDIRRWQGDSELEKRIKAQQRLYIPYKFINN